MSAKKEQKDKSDLLNSIKVILSKEDKLNEQLKADKGLERYTKDLLLLMSLVKDYYQGNYRSIPYKTISAAAVGLLYVLNPIDIIPDFIPFIGHIDDALVLGFCLKLIENDLKKYQSWKEKQKAFNNTDTAKSDATDTNTKSESK